MRKHKILFVTATWGFVAKFEINTVKLLQEMGYEVHLAANRIDISYEFPNDYYEKNNVIYHNIDIYQSPYAFTHNRRAIKQIREIIEKNDITIVHCHMPTGALCARLAAKNTKAYVIYTAHGFHFYKGGPKLKNALFFSAEKILARWTDAIVTINKEDFDAVDRLSTKVKKYRIPGIGLDREHFHGTSLDEYYDSRELLGFSDEFIFTNVALLKKNKNQIALIRALSELLKTGIDPQNVKLCFIGNGKDRPELENEVIRLGLKDNVVFYDYQQDVRNYLSMSDAFLFPSFREGFGMAAVEALSMGVPVIAADNRGTREYMHKGINGFVCKSNSPAEYADLMKEMYYNRDKWSRNPKKRAQIRQDTSKFDKAIVLKTMQRVYEDAKN